MSYVAASGSGTETRPSTEAYDKKHMPLSYEIDKQNKLLVCTASGFVTLNEVIVYRQQLLDDPGFDSTYSELVDLTGVTGTELTADQIRMQAETSIFSPGVRHALVGSSELLFGLARMFEIVRGLRGENDIRVFRNRIEALTWLLTKNKAA
jgi:hypothetical protein